MWIHIEMVHLMIFTNLWVRMGGWFHPPKQEKTRPFPVERFSSIFLRDMCINSYHSLMTKRIFQMNSRKYQNTGGKVEVLPPPHSDPLYNEVSNSFFNQVFRKCQLILGILINFSSLSKWNLTENWYLPITISKNTYCLYFRQNFRLFSHSRSLCRDAYILCYKSAFT